MQEKEIFDFKVLNQADMNRRPRKEYLRFLFKFAQASFGILFAPIGNFSAHSKNRNN
jgi:hypothetical protein